METSESWTEPCVPVHRAGVTAACDDVTEPSSKSEHLNFNQEQVEGRPTCPQTPACLAQVRPGKPVIKLL